MMFGMAEIFVLVALVVFLVLMGVTITNGKRRQRETSQPIVDDEYDAIRRRVAARYKRRGEFALHIVLFLFFTAAFWFVIPMPETAALWLSGAWLLVLISHGVKVLFDEAQERAVDREIARMQGVDGWDKPKRTHIELRDDGELVEVDAWDDEEIRKPKINER